MRSLLADSDEDNLVHGITSYSPGVNRPLVTASNCYKSSDGPRMILAAGSVALRVVPVSFGSSEAWGISCWASRGPWGRPFILEVGRAYDAYIPDLGPFRGRIALRAFRHALDLYNALMGHGSWPPAEWLVRGVPGAPSGPSY